MAVLPHRCDQPIFHLHQVPPILNQCRVHLKAKSRKCKLALKLAAKQRAGLRMLVGVAERRKSDMLKQ
jgi:hypothetical protein